MLCELETDKVTVEVPSPVAGTLSDIVAQEGDTVGVDALLAMCPKQATLAPKSQRRAPRPPQAQMATADAPVAAATGADNVDVMVPTLGESVTEATVSTWFKAVGDTVAQDEMLCELETIGSVEVPSPALCLSEIPPPKVPLSTPPRTRRDLRLRCRCGPAADAPAAAPAATSGKDVENAPSANKLMTEKGIDPANVQGSGRDGRIMKEDVLKAALAPAATPAPASTPRALSPPMMPRARNGSK